MPVFVDTIFVEGGQFDVQDSILVTYNSAYPYINMTVYELSENFEPVMLSEYQLGVSGDFTPRFIEIEERQMYIGVGGGVVTARLNENNEFVKLDEMTWGNAGFYDMWLFLDSPNPFGQPSFCISGTVLGVNYNFAIDVSDPSNIFINDTLPYSSTTLEPHGDVFYVTRSSAGYDMYGDYVVSTHEFETRQNSNDSINIFPNPSSGKTTLQFMHPSDEIISWRIFNTSGVLIFETQSKKVNQVQFDASGLTSGIYIVQAAGARFSASHKMLISR